MGRYRPTNVVCSICEKTYKGVWNQLTCNECKKTKGGYKKTCVYCGDSFFTNLNSVTHCDKCIRDKVYWRKKDYKSIAIKIQKTKKKWLASDKAKEFYNKLGKHNSKHLKQHFKTPAGIAQIKQSAAKQSKTMKKLIADGKFTPPITNSWTHWDAEILSENGNIKKFRSSWEAAFWLSNQHLEYETIRIPYELDGKSKMYIADFYVRDKNIVYEIKPRNSWKSQNGKMQEIITYCIQHNITFIWINEDNILHYINKNDFKNTNNKKQLTKLLNGIKKN